MNPDHSVRYWKSECPPRIPISSIGRDPFSDHHRHRPTQIHPHGNRPGTRYQHRPRITTHRSDTRRVHTPFDMVENVVAADLGDRKRRRSRPPPSAMASGGGGIGPRHSHHRNSPRPATLERFPTQERPHRRSCSGIRRGHARRCPAGTTRIDYRHARLAGRTSKQSDRCPDTDSEDRGNSCTLSKYTSHRRSASRTSKLVCSSNLQARSSVCICGFELSLYRGVSHPTGSGLLPGANPLNLTLK